MAIVALNVLFESLQIGARPRIGHSLELMYSSHVIKHGEGGGNDSFRGNSSTEIEKKVS